MQAQVEEQRNCKVLSHLLLVLKHYRKYSRITIFQALIAHTKARCAAHGGFDIDQLLFSAFPYTLDQIVGAIEVKTTQIEDGGQDVDAERRDCLKVSQ